MGTKRKSPWTTKRNLEDNPAKRPEVAKKISLSHLGKYPSEETKRKMSESRKKYCAKMKKLKKPKICKFCGKEFWNKNGNPKQKFCSKKCEGMNNRGSRNPNWRGGKFLERRPRESIRYKLWRLAVFERDNFTCQKCKQKGGKLVAHHLKSWTKYPKLRYEISNGKTLCLQCHYKTHNYGWRAKWLA